MGDNHCPVCGNFDATCPACKGHKYEKKESVVVPKSDLRIVLDRLSMYYNDEELSSAIENLKECL